MLSSVEDPINLVVGGGTSPGLGSDLRMARERLGWALADVALRLRIRMAFMVAIEEGHFSALPGHAYALGFVRSYAKLLGLDPDEIARRFRNEAREITGRTRLEFPAPVPERGVPAGAVVFLGCILSIAAYIGWYRVSGERPGAVVVETVPDRLAPLASLIVTAPPPPPAPVAPPPAPMPMQMGLPTYPPTSAGAAMPPPFFSIAPSPEVVAPPVTTPTVVQNGISQSGVAVPPSSSPSGGDHTDDSRIVIRARSDSWVQVRDKAGQTLINRVLRPGETYNVPTKQQLVLTTGNAGGVDLLVNGVATAPLGGMGVVRRDIPLDADTLRSGKVSAQRQSQSSGNPISP